MALTLKAANLYSQQAIQVPHFMPQPPFILKKSGLPSSGFLLDSYWGLIISRSPLWHCAVCPGEFHSMLVIDQ